MKWNQPSARLHPQYHDALLLMDVHKRCHLEYLICYDILKFNLIGALVRCRDQSMTSHGTGNCFAWLTSDEKVTCGLFNRLIMQAKDTCPAIKEYVEALIRGGRVADPVWIQQCREAAQHAPHHERIPETVPKGTAGPKPNRAYGEVYLRQAKLQLDVALVMKTNKFWSNCLWQMQQCIELALKGVLMCKPGISHHEEKSHSLEKLHRATADAGFSMPDSIQRHLPVLGPAYILARYPDGTTQLPMEKYSEDDVAPILQSLCDDKKGILAWLEDQGFLLPVSDKRPAEQPRWVEPAQKRQRCELPTSTEADAASVVGQKRLRED